MTEQPVVAVAVGFVRDEDVNFEALVLHDLTSGDTVEVQRSLRHDAQDAAAGMETYCLVRDGATHYGGLAAWRLDGQNLELFLDRGAAGSLSLPEVITLKVDQPQLIAEHLSRLIKAR